MLAFVFLGVVYADAPSVHYAASTPCVDHRYPRVIDGQIIVCDERQQPTMSFNPQTGEIAPREPDASSSKRPELRPQRRIGGDIVDTKTVWIWETDGPHDDADLWVQWKDKPDRRALDVGPGDQHHPVQSGPWVAWVNQGDLKLWNTSTNERKTLAASTGFNAPPAILDDWACWESRSETDIDVECSNGYRLNRPGHQTHPMLLGNTLFFREKGFLMSVQARTP